MAWAKVAECCTFVVVLSIHIPLFPLVLDAKFASMYKMYSPGTIAIFVEGIAVHKPEATFDSPDDSVMSRFNLSCLSLWGWLVAAFPAKPVFSE